MVNRLDGLRSVGRRAMDLAIISWNSFFGLAFFFTSSFFTGSDLRKSFSRFLSREANWSGGLGFRRGLALANLAGAFGLGFTLGFGLASGLGLGFGFSLGFGLAGGGGATATASGSGSGSGAGGGGGGAFSTLGAGGGGFTSGVFFSGSGDGLGGRFVFAAISTTSTMMGIS